jgi:hypothetical protein
MQPERCCCTLQLDSRLFYLSTLLFEEPKATLVDKHHVAETIVTRPD